MKCFIHQTSFKTKGTKDDERISIALGTIRFIEDGFKRFGFDKLLNSFKESGNDLVLSMKILCMETLLGESSMNHWERKMAKNPLPVPDMMEKS